MTKTPDRPYWLSTVRVKAAEDEGFEPSKGCPLHAFQACALGRYANPPAGFLGPRGKGIGGWK